MNILPKPTRTLPTPTPSRRVWLPLMAAVLLGIPSAEAQSRMRWSGSGGWAANADHVRAFNPGSLVSVPGMVDRVETFRPRRGADPGVRILLRIANEIRPVILGPRWFVEKQDIRIEPGDEVTVTGSAVLFNDESLILATSVSSGGNVLRLREPDGTPLWSAVQRAAGARPGLAAVRRWNLELPEGDINRGKTAYRDLWCHACHVAKGHESEFPAPYAQPPVPVVLGMEAAAPSRMDLVNSIVNPSHRLEPDFQKELVSAGKYSRMGDYNESMTLQQLSDLVAFLESLRK